MPYDPVKSFTPLSMLTEVTMVLAVNTGTGVKDLREFIEYARKNKVFFGSPGPGTTSHIQGLHLAKFANIPMTYVPYKDDAQTLLDLLSGQIHAYVAIGATVHPHINDPRMRIIAVFNDAPRSGFANTKLVSEQLPGFQSLTTYAAMWAPAGLPRPMTMHLNQAIEKALEDPGLRDYLLKNGGGAIYTTPEQLAEVVVNDLVRVGKLLKEAGIDPE